MPPHPANTYFLWRSECSSCYEFLPFSVMEWKQIGRPGAQGDIGHYRARVRTEFLFQYISLPRGLSTLYATVTKMPQTNWREEIFILAHDRGGNNVLPSSSRTGNKEKERLGTFRGIPPSDPLLSTKFTTSKNSATS